MPQTLDYATPTLRWWAKPRMRSRRAVTAAFVMPPVTISLVWLLTRIAIHFGHWDAMLLFLLALLIGSAACLCFAAWFAVGHGAWQVVLRFIGWVVFSGICAAAGLALFDLLPISVGDGP
jgi:hypothetical protein